MNQTYERLFEELSFLMSDHQIQQNLDQNIKKRAEKIIFDGGKLIANELQGCGQDLFVRKCSGDMSLPFEKIVLKVNHGKQSQIKGKFSLDASHGVVSNKKNSFAKGGARDKKSQRSRANSNQSKKIISRSRQKGLKELKSYNSQMITKISSRQKLHSKQRTKPHKTIQSNSSLRDCGQNRRRLKTQKYNVNHQTKRQKTQIQSSVRKIETESNHDNPGFVYSKNNSTEKGRAKATQILKKLAAIETEPSSFSASDRKRKEKSLEKEIKTLECVETKKEEVYLQRRMLEDTINELKIKIEAERSILKVTNSNITLLKRQISKKQTFKRQKSIEFDFSRKKSSQFSAESKQMKQKIIETTKTKDFLLQNITQQNYLIEMYMRVIEEMKNQITIQKTSRNDLKKQILSLKNIEKLTFQHCEQKEALSDQLFNEIKISLKKWQ